ncbi:hypothetical protein BJ912DRAFT_945439 [Pholiota molesta]|nr:hypothetical protein BJ912DRAFT_945439 [Pholiota molesta]
MFAKTAVAFLLPALVTAQVYGPAPGPSTPSTTAAAAVAVPSAPPSNATQINIDVAANGAFVFNPTNSPLPTTPHSVTQSSFANPCTYLAADASNSSSVAGFDSGLVLASTFTINVTDTQPIWFHCKQLTHCGIGMVGAINAPSSGNNTYQAFLSAAVALGSSQPDEAATTAGVTGGVHGIATALPASDTGAAASTSSNSDATKVAASAGLALFSAAFAMFALA